MKIGIPKELKNNESRVGMTPAGVYELTAHGHEVFVQQSAGEKSGFPDESYRKAGAKVLPTIEEVYAIAAFGCLQIISPIQCGHTPRNLTHRD